jgi:hypothetical protein
MNIANTITLTSTVMRAPEQVSGCIDARAILLSVDNGKYYSMNPMGTRIWERIRAPVRIDALIKDLLQEFDVDPRVCETEVLDFLARLQRERLLKTDS